MAYYDTEQLFRALSDARERSDAAPPELREGVQELLMILLLSAESIPERLERLFDVTVDCSPDVRPVVNSTLASLLARPYDEKRKIVEAVRGLLEDKADADDPFKDLFTT
jgi:hypothetical protein